eukprot:3671475-Rhodomonas_salina.2
MTNCNPVLTPMEVGQRLTSADCPEVLDKANVKEYQQLVGSLNYLVAWTRGNLAFTVSQLSLFMANPGPSHVAAAKRVQSAVWDMTQVEAHETVTSCNGICELT